MRSSYHWLPLQSRDFARRKRATAKKEVENIVGVRFCCCRATESLLIKWEITVGESAHTVTPDDYFQQFRKSPLRKPSHVSA